VYFSRLWIFLPLLAEFGCKKKAHGPPPRYAVVRFENLSGDPALDWTGRAASEVLSVTLAGALDGPVLSTAAMARLGPTLGARPAAAPGISTERAAAQFAGATRIVAGYIERATGGIRIVASERDLVSGKTLGTFSARGSVPLTALTGLGKEFTPAAKPYLTSNTSALQDYLQAMEEPVEASEGDLEKAVKLDPDFGPAWVAQVRLTRLRASPDAAATAIAEAKTHKLDPLSLAELDSETAAMSGDEAAKLAATRKVAALSPGDTVLLRTLAESESAGGEFAAAASDWKKLAELLPGDVQILNSLGYARGWAGDYAGAMAALQEYRTLRPNDANPLDSIGELQYTNRKFGEAAASWQQAYAKDPKFERGGELYKTAWAKFQTGDRKSADALFEQFRAARAKASDPFLPLLMADWLYRTGHMPDAVASLRKMVSENQQAALKSGAYTQLAIWDLIDGNRAEALKDALAAGNPNSGPAIIARFCVEPSASAEEWQTRSERLVSAPAMAQFRRTALGYALLFDGKRAAAIPVWAEIVKSSPATDFFSRAIYARLLKQPETRPLLPDPNNVNQLRALLDKL